jgi:hypothetical protein
MRTKQTTNLPATINPQFRAVSAQSPARRPSSRPPCILLSATVKYLTFGVLPVSRSGGHCFQCGVQGPRWKIEVIIIHNHRHYLYRPHYSFRRCFHGPYLLCFIDSFVDTLHRCMANEQTKGCRFPVELFLLSIFRALQHVSYWSKVAIDVLSAREIHPCAATRIARSSACANL